LWIRLRVMWCRRDTSDTVLPGADASARIAFFSSARCSADDATPSAPLTHHCHAQP
jgi:hypothetical protein